MTGRSIVEPKLSAGDGLQSAAYARALGFTRCSECDAPLDGGHTGYCSLSKMRGGPGGVVTLDQTTVPPPLEEKPHPWLIFAAVWMFLIVGGALLAISFGAIR